MSDSYLDHLPSHEREKILRRLRSPAEYERLREKVKGPEDLEREMVKADRLAEAFIRLESDPKLKETLRQTVEKDILEQGMENVLEKPFVGGFDVAIQMNPKTHEDQVVVIPEGVVQEAIPVKMTMSEQYVSQLISGGGGGVA
ncbi:MAG: hypothetical protein V1926_02415 [Candidatus Peregrinibacteria bacterium]